MGVGRQAGRQGGRERGRGRRESGGRERGWWLSKGRRRVFGERRLRVSMDTVYIRPLFREKKGIYPIPTHRSPL